MDLSLACNKLKPVTGKKKKKKHHLSELYTWACDTVMWH